MTGNNVVFALCRGSTSILTSLLLMGLLVAGATTARAQVQIEQMEAVSSQIEGATQGQLVVTLPGENCEPAGPSCEGVSRTDVLDLIPGGTPPLQGSGSGNSAVIMQRGDNNDATIEQQGPSDARPGQNNLAVLVQNGSFNQTTIRQRGQNNIAGIRLDGNDNGITLEQTGSNNEYLLDFTGSGLGNMGSSTTHRVSQIGSNNRLVQVGEGQMPFNVRQRGDGMRMVIRHDGN
jgi:hypothetical protein